MFGYKLVRERKLSYAEYIQRTRGLRRKSVGYLTAAVKRKGSNEWIILCKDKHNVGTNAGDDFLHNQVYVNDAAGTRGAGFIAVSSDVTAPADTQTTLAGEITTGGLARADATAAHSAGTNTTTIEHTFTASATHTNVQKTALFNAAAAGTMPHVNTFTATTLASGDELKVTWTITSTF